MSNELVKTPAQAGVDQRMQLRPTTIREAAMMADSIARSGLFAVKSPEQALVILMTGMELGLAPAQAFRGIHVVQGRAVLAADMMVGICKSQTNCEWFKLVESTDETATYEAKRAGEPSPTRLTYTIEDAKRAGLADKPIWKQYPAQMLRARCSSGLARVVFADLLFGLYTKEEISHGVEADPEDMIVLEPPKTPPQEVAPDKQAWQDARDRVFQAISAMEQEQRSQFLSGCQDRHGERNINLMSLEQLEEVYQDIQSANAEDKDESVNDAESDKAERTAHLMHQFSVEATRVFGDDQSAFKDWAVRVAPVKEGTERTIEQLAAAYEALCGMPEVITEGDPFADTPDGGDTLPIKVAPAKKSEARVGVPNGIKG